MNRINRYHLLNFLIGAQISCAAAQPAQQTSFINQTATTQEIKDFTQQAFALNTQLANMLFKPTVPFPTSSSNAQAVQTLYQVLGLDTQLIHDAQVCYFFIEYLVKTEIAAQFLAYYEQQKLGDPAKLIVPASSDPQWPAKQLQAWAELARQGNLQQRLKEIQAVTTPDWNLLNQTVRPALARMSWEQVVASDFWKSITITDSSVLVTSQFWQQYTNYYLSTLFVRDKALISSLTFSEKMLYPYIPTFQQSYYDDNMTAIRYSSELHRTQLAINDALRDRALEQSTAFKNMPIEKVWQQIQLFMEKPFYKLLARSTENPAELMSILAQKKSAITTFLKTEEQQELLLTHPLIIEELICIGMIKNIQARTYNIFSKDKLDATIQKLRAINVRPTPNIILFDYKEHAFLDDINYTMDYFSSNQQLAKTAPKQLPRKDEKVALTSLWDSVVGPLKKEGSDFVDTFKSMGSKLAKQGAQWASDIADASSDAWNASGDLSNFAKYETAYAFTGHKGDLQKASAAQRKANEEFAAAQKKYEKVWEDTTAIVKTVGEDVGGAVIGFAAGGIDDYLNELGIKSDLKDSTVGLWKSTIDTIVDTSAQFVHLLIFLPLETGMYAAFYGTEFINLATGSIMGAIIQSIKGDSSGWKELGDQLAELGSSMVTSFLSEVMFTVNQFLAVTKDVLLMAAYLAQLMAEGVLDVYRIYAAAQGGIAHLTGDEETEKWYKDSVTTAEAYRSTIVAVANTAIVIGAGIATDGLALGSIALNGGFQAPQVIGAAESDTQRIKDKADEEKLVKTFSAYVENSKNVAKKQQNDWRIEQNGKFLEQITNQERGLGFYQNFMNDYYESIKDTMSQQLGEVLQRNLTPQQATSTVYISEKESKDVTYQFVPADVGSLFGFTTGVYNLNPSQGFSVYTKARNSFSQEIAVNPATLGANAQESKPRRFWFLQKETTFTTAPVQEYHIRFQAISVLDEFYIGLYCGGTAVNLQEIVKTGKADLDAAHLAKMCVFKRESPQGKIMFDVYEHEGKGWFKTQIGAPEFVNGRWYHIKAQLNGTTLNVKVYQEGVVEPDWQQQLQVSATEQKSCGVIASGAAVEYQIIEPKPTIQTISSQLRPKITSTAAQQAQNNFAEFMEKMKPANVNKDIFKLTALDKTELLKGNYIYMCPTTGITQEVSQLETDYVVVCKAYSDNAIEKDSVTKKEMIGIDPQMRIGSNDEKVIISLISDKLFEPDGTWALNSPNNPVAYRPSWNAYLKSHPTMSDAVRNKIIAARKTYNAPLLQPVTFGAMTLTPTSADDVDARVFVYTAPSPHKALRDANIPDYFILTKLDNYQYPDVAVWGLPATEKSVAQRDIILSLVTGYWYQKGSDKAVLLPNSTTAQPLGVLVDDPSDANIKTLYDSYKEAGRTKLLDAIRKAQQAWSAVEQVRALARTATKNLATVTTTAISEAQAHTVKGTTQGAQPDTKPAEKSVTKQQQAATSSGF